MTPTLTRPAPGTSLGSLSRDSYGFDDATSLATDSAAQASINGHAASGNGYVTKAPKPTPKPTRSTPPIEPARKTKTFADFAALPDSFRSVNGKVQVHCGVSVSGPQGEGVPSDRFYKSAECKRIEAANPRAAEAWAIANRRSYSKSIVESSPDDEPTLAAFTNVERGNGDESYPKRLQLVLDDLRERTDNWPRRVDGSLFVDDPEHGIAWFEKPRSLFGWIHRKAGLTGVEWKQGSGYVSKDEFFAELVRTAKCYSQIEQLPHFPAMPLHYYASGDVQTGDGSAMCELLNRFCPATDIDRDLIQAAIVTQFWGGLAGTRPAFVFTADAGRGKGKSKLAEMLARVAGGTIDFSANDDMGQMKTRLLSPDGLTKRVALLDNVKSLRFSWAELEALITAPCISGKRNYVGEGRRPNTLTWFITLNGASLSTDMAQRSVIVKVGEPHRSKTWEEQTAAFIEANRQRIIGDCIGFLRSETTADLPSYSRWATWEAAVLSRLPEPADAQKVILERQGAVDVEREEADVIHDYFRHQLETLRYLPDREIVFIPSAVAARWLNWATGESKNVIATGRVMGQLIGEKRLPSLSRSACHTHGRGFVWTGQNADVKEEMKLDLSDRIAKAQAAKAQTDK